jgi:Uracil-DNA glycosylase
VTKLALVGEAWGKDEEASGLPFQGNAGRILNSLLAQVGIVRDECFVTNVLNLRPKPSNDIKNCTGPKTAGIPSMPALTPGKYMRAEFQPELDRLYAELDQVKPNLIVALGATAAWALLGTSGIAKIRGSVAASPWGKVLPTYHPQAVGYDWSLRPVLYADLCKAKREAEFPDLRRPRREIWVEPSLQDMDQFEYEHLAGATMLSIDIETMGDMITCAGFAPSPQVALVVPFYSAAAPGKNYWSTFAEEQQAWALVARWCKSPTPKVFQNGMYDVNFLWRTVGIPVANAQHDTMLLSHALQPELPKGLAFLGSIHTNEAAWKLMRRSSTAKREE